mgnify:CR=1 FL=1
MTIAISNQTSHERTVGGVTAKSAARIVGLRKCNPVSKCLFTASMTIQGRDGRDHHERYRDGYIVRVQYQQ